MIRILKVTLALFGGLILLFASLQSLTTENTTLRPAENPTAIPPSPTPVSIETLPYIGDLPFEDNQRLYQNDDSASVVTIYLTIRTGNISDNTHHTWEEVNSYNKWIYGSRSADLEVGKAEAIVQIGDESGPLPGELGYGAILPNATIQIRGASSSAMPQKSYKIELYKNDGQWRGQSTIALNKHIFDFSRVRNKLNFDLMKQISNLVSLRTQFVHLYVKDETTDPPGTVFLDYGLFTQIEQVNRRFLKNHLLDPNGQLYKATSFEFYRYADQLRMAEDPLYDVEAFQNLLEIKGNSDHSKLLQMLDDVNNYNIPITQTFEKYFEPDNYFTWLAFNILVSNIDTQNQNFYLYSPHNSNTWYFIPWDYDSSLDRLTRAALNKYPQQAFESGVANYWGSVLHNRVLREKEYRQQLDIKIKELLKFLTPERVEKMLASYKQVAESYAFRPPDLTYLGGSRNEYDWMFTQIPQEIQNNYNLYLVSLKKPMPFYLGTPVISRDQLVFVWDEAYTFEPTTVTYHFEVSRDADFNEIITRSQQDILQITTTTTEIFAPGTYYWRVSATNELGETQNAFDLYFDDLNDIFQDGTKSFTITVDRKVLEK